MSSQLNKLSKIGNYDSVRKSIKSIKQFDSQIEKNVGYSTKHIIIGFITVLVAIYVCMRLLNLVLVVIL